MCFGAGAKFSFGESERLFLLAEIFGPNVGHVFDAAVGRRDRIGSVGAGRTGHYGHACLFRF